MANYTAQQLADIRAAYALGAVEVDTPNMHTKFRSLDEMERIIRNVSADVEGASGAVRASFAVFSRD